MTTLGHCSRQVRGDKKLRGQPLVHSQRFGSLDWVPSCSFWLGLNRGCSPPSAGVSCSHGLSCVSIFSWVFIPHGILLVNIFLGFFINTCNGPFLATVAWYFFFCQALIILGSFLFDKVVLMKIGFWCCQWELGFDVTNENWVLIVANKNWALMLPMRIGLWMNRHGFESWASIMDFEFYW